jgi:hypothetical protein
MGEGSGPPSDHRSSGLIAPVWHTVLLVSIFLVLTMARYSNGTRNLPPARCSNIRMSFRSIFR